MKKIAYLAFVSAAALSLSACGSSDDASTDATADNVELPADEAMSSAPEPAADPNANTADDASDSPMAASASQAGDDAAAAAADAADAADLPDEKSSM